MSTKTTAIGAAVGLGVGIAIPIALDQLDPDPSMSGAYCAMLFFSVPLFVIVGSIAGFFLAWFRGR